LQKTPKLLSSDTQLLMRERYETIFRIFDHEQPGVSPLAPMLLHPAENSSVGGGFQRRLKDFMAFDVLKYTGENFKTFMSHTREQCEIILQECKEKQARDSAALPPV